MPVTTKVTTEVTTEVKIIAIAGGSCSGKSSLARHLASTLGEQRCGLVYQDSYYRDDDSISNYDEPSALEFALLAQHLRQLKQGQSAMIPSYDFTVHRRKPQRQKQAAKDIIIVDGILILHAPELAGLFDLSVFVRCDQAIRRQRRIQRDSVERGRSIDSIVQQFDQQVAPLHDRYVEPSVANADLVYENNGLRPVAELLCPQLLAFCHPPLAGC